MEEKLSIIYKITNIKNGYIYIGSTTYNIEKRLKEHFKSARNGCDSNLLYEDMRKQSKEDFIIEEIDTCFPRHRKIVEADWTKKYRARKDVVLYNKKDGDNLDENTIKRIFALRELNADIYKSDRFKAKVSQATRGENNGMYGHSGENAINGRIVISWIDKEHTQMVKTYVSQLVALNELGIKGHSGMNKAIRNNELYHGYYWTKEWIDR